MDDLSRYQDVLGQLPRLKTYTHLLLLFPLQDEDDRHVVVQSLRAAIQRLTKAFPWLAYKVCHNEKGPGNSGVFRVEPCPVLATPDNTVRPTDCSHTLASYEEIVAARAPISMLDGRILGPVKAFPETYEESASEPAPVLVLQVNFVDGGILLDTAAQHNIIDGGGLLHCTRLLAKAMRGDEFTSAELEQGNRDRRHLVRLLSAGEPMLDHSHLIREPLSGSSAHQHPAASGRTPASWACYRFPSANVARIKDRANKDITEMSAPGKPFVSTNDALSAFVWKRLAAVRLARRQKPDDFSKFSRALDARRALQIPKEYMGQMGYNATCHMTFQELQDSSLGDVALLMRRAVQDVNSEYSVRSWATLIANEPDKSKIMFGGTFNPDTDIGLSSLIHAGVEGVVFGMLGKPDLIRRPRFLPLESCVYFWSRTEAEDVDVLMCLRSDDMRALREEEEWSNAVEFIG